MTALISSTCLLPGTSTVTDTQFLICLLLSNVFEWRWRKGLCTVYYTNCNNSTDQKMGPRLGSPGAFQFGNYGFWLGLHMCELDVDFFASNLHDRRVWPAFNVASSHGSRVVALQTAEGSCESLGPFRCKFRQIIGPESHLNHWTGRTGPHAVNCSLTNVNPATITEKGSCKSNIFKLPPEQGERKSSNRDNCSRDSCPHFGDFL